MSQRVESLPASFFLGGQVEVGQDLTRGARTPLCGRTGELTLMWIFIIKDVCWTIKTGDK